PFATTHASTAHNTSATITEAPRGMGWSSGMASQESLPNTSVLLGGVMVGARTIPRRQLLGEDRSKETGLHAAVGVGLYLLALTQQVLIRAVVQRGALRMCRGDPVRKVICRQGMHGEVHVGESIAVEMRGQPGVITGRVSL